MAEKGNPIAYPSDMMPQSNAEAPPSYEAAANASPYPQGGVYPSQPGVYVAQHPPPPTQPVVLNPIIYTVEQPRAQVQQTVFVVNSVKMAPSFDPYLEYCQKCQAQVTTNVQYVMGFCSWLMFFLGIFIFFPLLCCFCLKSFQDAKHFCPNCGTLLAIKRR